MARGSQLKMEGTDTELSVMCDTYLDARVGMDTARGKLHEAETALIEAMRTAGKKSIKHEGRIIRAVHQDAKDKVQVVQE